MFCAHFKPSSLTKSPSETGDFQRVGDGGSLVNKLDVGFRLSKPVEPIQHQPFACSLDRPLMVGVNFRKRALNFPGKQLPHGDMVAARRFYHVVSRKIWVR